MALHCETLLSTYDGKWQKDSPFLPGSQGLFPVDLELQLGSVEHGTTGNDEMRVGDDASTDATRTDSEIDVPLPDDLLRYIFLHVPLVR